MKTVLIRALKTFIQACLGYLCTMNIVNFDIDDKNVLVGILISSISAGISAIMNISWKEGKQDENN